MALDLARDGRRRPPEPARDLPIVRAPRQRPLDRFPIREGELMRRPGALARGDPTGFAYDEVDGARQLAEPLGDRPSRDALAMPRP
jgi:hypothetical protein